MASLCPTTHRNNETQTHMKKTRQTESKHFRGRLLLALLAGLGAATAHVHAQGTAFTYQGNLSDGGGPANGNYDLTFALYDDPLAGSQAGMTVTNLNVGVSNGLVTTLVDFGPGLFDGTPYWLQVGVRSNGVAVVFSPLSPRQPVTPAPYAIYAATAPLADDVVTSAKILDGEVTQLDLADNSVTSAKIVDGEVANVDLADNSVNSAKIADGTVTSADIANGTVTSTDIANGTVTSTDIADGTITTADLNLASVDGRYVLKAGDVMTGDLTTPNLTVNGRLGIGTASPVDSLHVFDSGNEGDVMIENLFPFLTFQQSGSNNNAGLLFTDVNGYSGWLFYRGTDQALTMGSTAGSSSPNTLVLQRDGNAGIGTSSAFTRLTVNGTIGFSSPSTPAAYIYESGIANVVKPLFVHSPSFPGWGLFYDDSTDEFVIGSTTTNDPALVVSAGGDWVAINTSTRATGYELSVDGQIACEEILVQDSGSWPDYVFEDNYPLKPLNEVETHIKERKHLPGIPTAKEIAVTGISVGDMQKRMMEKIEELTLYVIEQDKRLAVQEKTITELRSKLQEIQP